MPRRHQVLFVCHDAGGTVPPVLAVAQALLARGCGVAVLSQPSVRRRAEAEGCQFFAFSSLDDYHRHTALEEQLALSVPAIAGASVGEDLLAVGATVDADVVVVDPNLAGALAAAESMHARSVVLLHSMYATFVDTWFADLWVVLADLINETRRAFGLEPRGSWASLFDGHDLVVSPVPSTFEAPVSVERPAHLRQFGFLVPTPEGERVPFPAGDDPAVLVGLSTTYQHQEALLQRIVEALSGLPVRGLVTTAGQALHDDLRAGPNVVVVDYAPHAVALQHADVLVTHAGLGTVAAGLSAGVPLVCTPLGRDQHLNAERASLLGAAVVLEDASAPAIADAVSGVLADASYGRAAQAIGRTSSDEGGAVAAAEAVLA